MTTAAEWRGRAAAGWPTLQAAWWRSAPAFRPSHVRAASTSTPPGCVPAPHYTTVPSEALRRLRSDGAVILQVDWASLGGDGTGINTDITQDMANAIPPAVFGKHLRCATPATTKRGLSLQRRRQLAEQGSRPVLPRDGRKRGVSSDAADRQPRPGDVGLVANRPHQDASWGPSSPEYLLLLCQQPTDDGGESYLLDGRDLVERSLSLEQQADLRRVLYEPHHYKPMGDGAEHPVRLLFASCSCCVRSSHLCAL